MQWGPQANGRATDGQMLEFPGEGRWDRLQHRADGTTQVRSIGRLPDDLRRVVQNLTGEAKQLREDLAQGWLLIHPQQPDRAREVAFLGKLARCGEVGIEDLFPRPKNTLRRIQGRLEVGVAKPLGVIPHPVFDLRDEPLAYPWLATPRRVTGRVEGESDRVGKVMKSIPIALSRLRLA